METIIREEKGTPLIPAGYYNILDAANMHVYSVGYGGASVTLSDQSGWSVRGSDRYKVAHWPTVWDEQYGIPAAEVYLTSNNAYYTHGWKYQMVNVYTGESALVNITMAPAYAYTNAIYSIDSYSGTVVLMSASGNYAVFALSDADCWAEI